MICNHETAAGWAYHDGTKHSFRSVRDNAHFLDWPNKPLPFKIYTTLDPIELPREVAPLDMPALEAISQGEWGAEEKTIFPIPHSPFPTPEATDVPDLKDLAQILYYSAGITRIKQYSGGEINTSSRNPPVSLNRWLGRCGRVTLGARVGVVRLPPWLGREDVCIGAYRPGSRGRASPVQGRG